MKYLVNNYVKWNSKEPFPGMKYVDNLQQGGYQILEYGKIVPARDFDIYIKAKRPDSTVGYIIFNNSVGTYKAQFGTSRMVTGKGSSDIAEKLASSFNEFDTVIEIGIDNVEIPLSELAGYMAGFFFDMRDIHFNVRGKEFYTYHKLAEELYQKAEDFYDDLVETAMTYGEFCDSMQCIPNDWSLLSLRDISIDAAIAHICDRLKCISEKIKSVKKGYDTYVYSKLDSMSEYFAKELYKINQANAPFEE